MDIIDVIKDTEEVKEEVTRQLEIFNKGNVATQLHIGTQALVSTAVLQKGFEIISEIVHDQEEKIEKQAEVISAYEKAYGEIDKDVVEEISKPLVTKNEKVSSLLRKMKTYSVVLQKNNSRVEKQYPELSK